MNKDFDNWNERKKEIDKQGSSFRYCEQDLWWCNIGINIGFEQDGVGVDCRRPVLILKDLGRSTCFVVPLTTSNHVHKFRICIGIVGNEKSYAIISQLRVIDTKRLIKKIGSLDKVLFDHIRKTIKDIL